MVCTGENFKIGDASEKNAGAPAAFVVLASKSPHPANYAHSFGEHLRIIFYTPRET